MLIADIRFIDKAGDKFVSASHAIRPTLYYSGIINTTCRSVVMKLSHFGLILFKVISVKYQKKDDL